MLAKRKLEAEKLAKIKLEAEKLEAEKLAKEKSDIASFKNEPSTSINTTTYENLIIARELVKMLSTTRASDYNKWIEVGTILHQIDYILLYEWSEFTRKCALEIRYLSCADIWSKLKPTELDVSTLKTFAYADSPKEFLIWLKSNPVAHTNPSTDTKIEITKADIVISNNLSKVGSELDLKSVIDGMKSLNVSKIQIKWDKVIVQYKVTQ